MDFEHLVAIFVAVVGAVSAIIDLVIKLITEQSLLEKLVGQYRGKVLVGILLLTCLALGTLFGEHHLKNALDANHAWAQRVEDEKKVLLEAINQMPVMLREYDSQCGRKGAACVILYDEEGLRGRRLALPVGEYPDLRMLGFNDTARSIEIHGNAHAFAFIDWQFGGKVEQIDRNVPSLATDFSKQISSVKVLAVR